MSLEQTHRRRQAVDAIHDIVGAMRAVAAGRIQGAQRALAASRRYAEVVHRAIAALGDDAAISAWPAPSGLCATLLVMTSEQPLCGPFNQNVLALVERRWAELNRPGRPYLVVVGERGRRQLAVRGIVADRLEPAASSLAGVRGLVKRLASLMVDRLACGELGSLSVIYSRYQSISEQVPTEEQILPPDLERIRRDAAPRRPGRFDRFLPPGPLLAGLIGEYALISLYRLGAESFASEQASRLVAMDGATRNTEQILQSLIELEQRERQDEITRQVLELIGARFATQ